jgi:hypothetical protein
MLPAGVDGCATRYSGEVPMRLTPVRSFSESYGSFAKRCGLTAICVTSATSSV